MDYLEIEIDKKKSVVYDITPPFDVEPHKKVDTGHA